LIKKLVTQKVLAGLISNFREDALGHAEHNCKLLL